MKWILIFLTLGFTLFCNGTNHGKPLHIKNLQRKSLQEITVTLMIHFDTMLTKKLRQNKKISSLTSLKNMTNSLLREVEEIFLDPILNIKLKLNLLDTKFLKTDKAVVASENASKYLGNYCEWQAVKKQRKKKMFFSILFTGLDLYGIRGDGIKVKQSVARGYRNGICNINKSCAIFEWRPDIMTQLIAHEIGHSLGMVHDQEHSYYKCKPGIMTSRYPKKQRQRSKIKWSICNALDLKRFLTYKKADCLVKKS